MGFLFKCFFLVFLVGWDFKREKVWSWRVGM